MGLWAERILPRCVDRVLSAPDIAARRALVCAGLTGRVLELGFGSGLNLPHYPDDVTEVLAVEPSDLAMELAAARISALGRPVQRVGLDGARLDLPDASVDTVLSTYTLCTIPDTAGALREVVRVLRPGGSFHFLEHGRSPDASVRRWQRRLNPIQRRFAGGCRLDEPIDELIGGAGLQTMALTTGYSPGMRATGYLYRGVARRRPDAA
ncbi:MAG: class I SAM-dependent methyltransferase [Propionibacteriaceae bacterium]